MPPRLAWIDVGCGTGALSHAVLAQCAPRLFAGVDRSPGYLSAARRAAGAEGRFLVADARELPFAGARFDVAVSGLVLNFVPDPPRMVAEMARLLRPGGRLALYVWDYAGHMELMRYFWDAAVELDPAVAELDEGRRFPICQPNPLRQVFQDCGLDNVEVRAIDVPTIFSDFDDYWAPFLGGQGPAPGYAVSLSEAQRAELRARIRSRLPRAADGSISLTARAWAVRGLARSA
jgi:SAM-dependent methyltransferase